MGAGLDRSGTLGEENRAEQDARAGDQMAPLSAGKECRGAAHIITCRQDQDDGSHGEENAVGIVAKLLSR
jgi:hypothetical protein